MYSYESILHSMPDCSTAPTSDFLDRYLPYLLRKADQTLSAPFYAVLARAGVARSEWRLLSVLEDLGDLRVADLAVAALSPQPTVTHALRRLEDRGLVIKTVDGDDRRQRVVALTPAGSSLTSTLIADAALLESKALAGADGLEELAQQLRALTRFVEARVTTAMDDEAWAGCGDQHDRGRTGEC